MTVLPVPKFHQFNRKLLGLFQQFQDSEHEPSKTDTSDITTMESTTNTTSTTTNDQLSETKPVSSTDNQHSSDQKKSVSSPKTVGLKIQIVDSNGNIILDISTSILNTPETDITINSHVHQYLTRGGGFLATCEQNENRQEEDQSSLNHHHNHLRRCHPHPSFGLITQPQAQETERNIENTIDMDGNIGIKIHLTPNLYPSIINLPPKRPIYRTCDQTHLETPVMTVPSIFPEQLPDVSFTHPASPEVIEVTNEEPVALPQIESVVEVQIIESSPEESQKEAIDEEIIVDSAEQADVIESIQPIESVEITNEVELQAEDENRVEIQAEDVKVHENQVEIQSESEQILLEEDNIDNNDITFELASITSEDSLVDSDEDYVLLDFSDSDSEDLQSTRIITLVPQPKIVNQDNTIQVDQVPQEDLQVDQVSDEIIPQVVEEVLEITEEASQVVEEVTQVEEATQAIEEVSQTVPSIEVTEEIIQIVPIIGEVTKDLPIIEEVTEDLPIIEELPDHISEIASTIEELTENISQICQIISQVDQVEETSIRTEEIITKPCVQEEDINFCLDIETLQVDEQIQEAVATIITPILTVAESASPQSESSSIFPPIPDTENTPLSQPEPTSSQPEPTSSQSELSSIFPPIPDTENTPLSQPEPTLSQSETTLSQSEPTLSQPEPTSIFPPMPDTENTSASSVQSTPSIQSSVPHTPFPPTPSTPSTLEIKLKNIEFELENVNQMIQIYQDDMRILDNRIETHRKVQKENKSSIPTDAMIRIEQERALLFLNRAEAIRQEGKLEIEILQLKKEIIEEKNQKLIEIEKEIEKEKQKKFELEAQEEQQRQKEIVVEDKKDIDTTNTMTTTTTTTTNTMTATITTPTTTPATTTPPITPTMAPPTGSNQDQTDIIQGLTKRHNDLSKVICRIKNEIKKMDQTLISINIAHTSTEMIINGDEIIKSQLNHPFIESRQRLTENLKVLDRTRDALRRRLALITGKPFPLPGDENFDEEDDINLY